MLEELWSPAFQQDAVVVTETGLFGTAKDATQITTVTKWGPPQRPISIKPPLHPSTPGNVAPLAGHKRRIPLGVVLPRPARGAGTLIPSAQRLVWAAKQLLGNAALGPLFGTFLQLIF